MAINLAPKNRITKDVENIFTNFPIKINNIHPNFLKQKKKLKRKKKDKDKE